LALRFSFIYCDGAKRELLAYSLAEIAEMINVENIGVRYTGREVLADVSFELNDGEIIALIGPNGAGKTTLLRVLNRTAPLSNGTVTLGGKGLNDLSRREIAHRIAVVAQENETRFPITVFEFVLSGRFAYGGRFGWETEDDINSAKQALSDCDLLEYSDRLMNELSGGERQRVVLARALAGETLVLLLDEPTANLDLAHQALMFKLVRERCRTCRASAIVITHDLNLAAEFADRVLMLDGGRLFALGTAGEVLTAENIEKVFGVRALLDKNPVSRNVRVTTLY
jgi:iron complex transport system ATP-binding protein